MDPRTYLLNRFQGDADALRVRAQSLRTGAPQPGPDAQTSQRMADACDDIVATLQAMLPRDTASENVAALQALIPLFEKRGASVSHAPAVRSVYVGAATRIREIGAAEARQSVVGGTNDDDDVDDSDFGDIDAADADDDADDDADIDDDDFTDELTDGPNHPKNGRPR